MSLAGGLRELLRPPPHRGPLIAAGGVALAVGVSLTVLRLRETLPLGALAAILLAPGALLFWLGAQAPNEHGEPPAYQSVLLATGLPLIYAGLLALLGASLEPWVLLIASAITGALAVWPALERNSAISLLGAAILAGVALLSAWWWLFGETAHNWPLLAYAAALVLASLALREPARRHAEVLVDAAGLAIAAIALSAYVLDLGRPSGFWALILLGAGLGLVAFGALDRSPGPAYLGVLNLGLFILSESAGTGLLVWPLVLLAGGAVMLGAGLRPRRPLPPEPDPYRAGEAPLAARVQEPR